MLIASIVCFGLAILIGLAMFLHVIQDKPVPRILPFIHGPFALAGIILLLISSMNSTPLITIAVVFILAALGGLTLFYKDMTGKPIPKMFAVGHGFLAFSAFLFLVIYTFVNQ